MNIHIGDRALNSAVDTHPDWAIGYSLVSDYLIAGASAVGQLHLYKQVPRDDAFTVRSYGPWVAIAVADGLGSKPLSRFGATYTVESLSAQLLRLLTKRLPQEQAVLAEEPGKLSLASPGERPERPLKIRRELYEQHLASLDPSAAGTAWEQQADARVALYEEVSQKSGSLGWYRTPVRAAPLVDLTPQELEEFVRQAFELTHRGLHDYARGHFNADAPNLGCTALAALLNLETGQGAIGQVGDGMILLWDGKDEAWDPLRSGEPDDPTMAHTITARGYQKHLSVQVLPLQRRRRLGGIFVMTDGISSDLLYKANAEQQLAQWARAISRNLEAAGGPEQAATSMVGWLATYQSQGNWDDRTLVAVIRQEQSHGNSADYAG